MSDADRNRWNHRYRDRSHGRGNALPNPSALLSDWCPDPTLGSRFALDVACGRGRNAIYLAQRGYSVDAADISSVALAELDAVAAANDLAIRPIEIDLDEGSFEPDRYGFVAMVRYVNGPLAKRLTQSLCPGGYILIEQHMNSDQAVSGPSRPQFRVQPGELRHTVGALELLYENEAIIETKTGEYEALSQVVARRPGNFDEPTTHQQWRDK